MTLQVFGMDKNTILPFTRLILVTVKSIISDCLRVDYESLYLGEAVVTSLGEIGHCFLENLPAVDLPDPVRPTTIHP